jgi:hypothetical protein
MPFRLKRRATGAIFCVDRRKKAAASTEQNDAKHGMGRGWKFLGESKANAQINYGNKLLKYSTDFILW